MSWDCKAANCVGSMIYEYAFLRRALICCRLYTELLTIVVCFVWITGCEHILLGVRGLGEHIVWGESFGLQDASIFCSGSEVWITGLCEHILLGGEVWITGCEHIARGERFGLRAFGLLAYASIFLEVIMLIGKTAKW